MLPFELTKDTPYLALSGELWSVFCEYFNRNWPCYKGFLLYIAPTMDHRCKLTQSNIPFQQDLEKRLQFINNQWAHRLFERTYCWYVKHLCNQIVNLRISRLLSYHHTCKIVTCIGCSSSPLTHIIWWVSNYEPIYLWQGPRYQSILAYKND